MILKAKVTPYSSIVGGGLLLTDETGAARFVVSLRGTTAGITKEETEAISSRLASLIEAGGLSVPARHLPSSGTPPPDGA